MNSEMHRDQSGDANAGAAKTSHSQEALRQGVRKNASHPGDASNAAGMRRDKSAEPERSENASGDEMRQDAADE